MTCTKDSNGDVTSYEWYKDGNKDANAAAVTWNIGNTGASGNGDYTCKVVTAEKTSDASDELTVLFGEYHNIL